MLTIITTESLHKRKKNQGTPKFFDISTRQHDKNGSFSAHKAKMASTLMGVTSVRDRFDHAKRHGVGIDDLSIRNITNFNRVIKCGDTNLSFQLNNISVGEIDLKSTKAKSPEIKAEKVLNAISPKLPDENAPHTINIEKYLSNRVPSGAIEQIRHKGCDIFCNNGELSVLEYYKGEGFDRACKINSNTSTDFYLFTNSSNGESKVVLSGMDSQTRIKHQLLQLHFSGVDLNQINMVGSLDEVKNKLAGDLHRELQKLPDADYKIFFIGARWQIMDHFGKKIHPSDGDVPEGVGYTRINPTNHNIGGFVFDTAIFESDGKKYLVAALRMPNGDLAYEATKVFIDNGFNNLIMCGAGGRIHGNCKVGDYVPLNQTKYDDEVISLNPGNIHHALVTSFLPGKTTMGRSVTVDSPLQETHDWLSKHQMVNGVDVETAHIFRAVNENTESGVRVLPGFFVSDVLGEHPLESKISTANAFKKLPYLVDAVFDVIVKSEISQKQQRILDAYGIETKATNNRSAPHPKNMFAASRNGDTLLLPRKPSSESKQATLTVFAHKKDGKVRLETGAYVSDKENGDAYGEFRFYDGSGLKKYQSSECYLKQFDSDTLAKLKNIHREQKITYFLRDLLDCNDIKLMNRYASHQQEFAVLGDFLVFPNLPHMASYDLSKTSSSLKENRHGMIIGAWMIHPNQNLSFIEKIDPDSASRIKSKLPLNRNNSVSINDERTIGQIENGTGIKYFSSILDLTKDDVPMLKDIRKNVLKHIAEVYNIDHDKDRVKMSFHFPVQKTNATLHLHISVNRAAHPLDVARSFELDELITNLENGVSIETVILERDDSGYGKGSYLIPKTDNAGKSTTKVVKNTQRWPT